MSNTRLRLLLGPLTVLVAIVVTTGAAASPPTVASGTVGNTSSTFNSVRAADGNLIVELTANATYTGTHRYLDAWGVDHPRTGAPAPRCRDLHRNRERCSRLLTFDLNGSNNAALEVHATATISDASGSLPVCTACLTGRNGDPTGPVGTPGRIGWQDCRWRLADRLRSSGTTAPCADQ
jgi:hypothetical protein